ncbi:integrase [Gossypium australe]|uniref:Integrase n=1 Tax=Gossypium australe TaxID=47621 RepID=A0A5B6WGZ8_9ROSI|nr:integrase [Gossypium australe]
MNDHSRLEQNGVLLAKLKVKPTLLQDVKDIKLTKKQVEDAKKKKSRFEVESEGNLHFQSRLYVPNSKELKENILREAHCNMFIMHIGKNNMYRDLKFYYWWKGMEMIIVEHVFKCLICQQVKVEHQVPLGLLQPITILEWN